MNAKRARQLRAGIAAAHIHLSIPTEMHGFGTQPFGTRLGRLAYDRVLRRGIAQTSAHGRRVPAAA